MRQCFPLIKINSTISFLNLAIVCDKHYANMHIHVVSSIMKIQAQHLGKTSTTGFILTYRDVYFSDGKSALRKLPCINT